MDVARAIEELYDILELYEDPIELSDTQREAINMGIDALHDTGRETK